MSAIETSPAPVTEQQLRAALARLKQQPLDPREGLFGPRSMFWEVNRHTVVYFLGAVQSVQYQLAHPWVAVAIAEHSKIMTDPRRRAQLTYKFLWSFIYGDLDRVMKMSLGLFKVHGRVTGQLGEQAGRHAAGSNYVANEAHAMLWVHVTAFYSRVRLYETLVRPLTRAEKDRFVDEAKLYAFCFGIPDDIHPRDWQAVEDYVAAMAQSDTLARTEQGVKVSRFLRNTLPKPVRNALWAFICLPVPARVGGILGLPEDTAANRASARRMQRFLRTVMRLLPDWLAYVPAYHEALGRLAGRSEPDWLTARLNTLFLGTPKLVT